MNRRSLLLGLGSSLVAAPAIVPFASLMPVRGIVMDVAPTFDGWVDDLHGSYRGFRVGDRVWYGGEMRVIKAIYRGKDTDADTRRRAEELVRHFVSAAAPPDAPWSDL